MPRGISGKLFPIHLKPKDDELLSSWLVRLSLAHGLSLPDLNRILYPQSKINICQQQDIDFAIREYHYKSHRPRNLLLATLSERTGTPLDRVRQTTFDEYEERLFYKVTSSKLYSWITPHNSSRFRSEPKFGMQACPKCLDEDDKPYFRRRWRFAFVVVCPWHNCYLIDRCPGCGGAIQFQRSAVYLLRTPADAMTSCYKCGFDLRNALSLRKPVGAHVAPEVIEFQEKLVRYAKQDYIKEKRMDAVKTGFFFEKTHWMLSVVVRPHAITRKFQSAVFRHYGLHLSLPDLTINCSLQRFDVRRRYELVRTLNRILLDHPYRYIEPSLRDDLICRVWLFEWHYIEFWRSGVLSAERRNYGNKGVYDGKRSSISDLYIGNAKRQIWEINPKYLDEFKEAAARLFMDGLRTLQIASLLAVSPREAHNWTLEHPDSAVAAREAGRRGIKKR